MFSWKSTTPADGAASLHDMLAFNTANYRQGRKDRIEKEVNRVYPIARQRVLDFSKNSNKTVFELAPQFTDLCTDERFEALEHLKDRFVNAGVECHTTGEYIKIVWSVSDQ